MLRDSSRESKAIQNRALFMQIMKYSCMEKIMYIPMKEWSRLGRASTHKFTAHCLLVKFIVRIKIPSCTNSYHGNAELKIRINGNSSNFKHIYPPICHRTMLLCPPTFYLLKYYKTIVTVIDCTNSHASLRRMPHLPRLHAYGYTSC